MKTSTYNELLLSASRELLLLVDPATLAILEVNEYASELLGVSRQDILGQPITAYETALQDVFYWDEVAEGNFYELINAEGLYACADGEFVPVEKSIRMRSDITPPVIVICARDARATVNATSKLLEASAILQATFESTAEGILVLSRDGQMLNHNGRCLDIWRHSAEGTDVRSQLRLLRAVAWHALHPKIAVRRWRQLVQQDTEEHNESFELKDGRTIRCRSRPLMMQEQIEGRVVSFSDITESIQRENELAKARDAAAASSKAKADFLAMMSHEIRTPLTGILGMTELVLDTELAPTQREHLEMSNQSARGLLAIINDILDFSRIEAGKMQIEHIPFDLIAALQLATKPLTWQAKQRGLQLSLQLPPTPQQWLQGDPTRIQQIIINLVGNAIKFTESGSVTVSVVAGSATPDGVPVTLSVRDTGIGISPAKLHQIFEAFTQADASTNRRFGGTGLGLAISNRLAQLMDGRIDVESDEGKGSCFKVLLCLPEAQAPVMAPVSAPIVPTNQHSLNILVAEDTRANQVFLSSIIKKAGHRSVICNNGQEAVDTLHREPTFDLVLMDIQMPVMDGFSATRLIREHGISIPIIALTAHATEGFREECLAHGMNDYLAKPIDTRLLLEKIGTYALTASPQDITDESPSADGEPVFDFDGALGRMDGDRDLLLILVDAVLEQIGNDLDCMRNALASSDGMAAAKAAHRLKGSMSAVGAVRSTNACNALEQAGRSGDLAPLPKLFDALMTEIAAVRPLLVSFKQSPQ
jgi:two-component system sensor histidine kinase/response regulator